MSEPATDWKASLPEDLRSDPVFKDIADVNSLAKSYQHASRMVGADKVLKPNDKFTPEQWNEFYGHAGRPTTVDGYKLAADLIPQGMQVDDAKFKAAKEELFKAGLNSTQANQVLKYYFNSTHGSMTALQQQQETERSQAMTALKTEYGDGYDANMDLAGAVIKKFASEPLQKLMEESKWGNNPHMVKFLVQVGKTMMEDSATGSGSGLIVTNATQAKAELDQLKGDPAFIKTLTDRMSPGHQQAKEKWELLHRTAAGQVK